MQYNRIRKILHEFVNDSEERAGFKEMPAAAVRKKKMMGRQPQLSELRTCCAAPVVVSPMHHSKMDEWG